MENGIFGILAAEERAGDNVEVEVFDAAEDVLAEEAYTEAMEIANDINVAVAASAKAEQAGEIVAGQIAREEILLANPERITADVVRMSNESMVVIGEMLGMSKAESAKYALSNEAIDENPVSAMQVSHENKVTDFLKKIYESVKAIFVRVINAAKKLFVKLVVAMDGTAKKAKTLQKTINGIKGEATEKEFSESDSKSLNKMFAAALLAEGKTNVFELKDQPAVDVAIMTVTPTFDEDEAKSNKNIVSQYEKLVSKDDTAALKKSFKYDEPSDAKGGVKASIVYTKGASAKVVEIYTKDDEKETAVVKVKNVSADLDNLGDAKLPVPAIATLKSKINEVIKGAGDTKKVSGDAMKAIDAANKELDKLAKASEGSYIINKLKAGEMTRKRDMVVGLGLDSVLAHVANVKGNLSLCARAAKMYKTGAEM